MSFDAQLELSMLYFIDVDRCMKAHKGNIADCVPQWKAFRDCHEAQRTLREAQRASQGQQVTFTTQTDAPISPAPTEVKSIWRQWQDALFKTS